MSEPKFLFINETGIKTLILLKNKFLSRICDDTRHELEKQGTGDVAQWQSMCLKCVMPWV